MISRNKMKLLRSLSKRKFRDEHALFLVEGEKMVLELLEQSTSFGFQVAEIFASPSWVEKHGGKAVAAKVALNEADEQELRAASNLVNPQEVIALVQKPVHTPDMKELRQKPVLAFDAIRDPGNLGTIIRTADWFGISHLVCSTDSVDCFNPKVVQATMGAFMRVRVYYENLETFLKEEALKGKPVLGTLLQGESMYNCSFGEAPLILFGNESRGLSPLLRSMCDRPLTIPPFSTEFAGSESLNLASSVAVVCSEFRRPAR